MRWIFGPFRRLRKRGAANETRRRNSADPARKSPRRIDDFAMIMAVIGALLLTLQQADALNARRPVAQVGDRIVFTPGMAVSPGFATVIPARVVTGPWAPPARACRLNLGLLTNHWGALTVLAVRADGVMLSWAGGATAEAGNDCAPAHKLLVSDVGFNELLTLQRNEVRALPR
jgi:hypothetical protein